MPLTSSFVITGSQLYISLVSLFCVFIPIGLMVFCYSKIVLLFRGSERLVGMNRTRRNISESQLTWVSRIVKIKTFSSSSHSMNSHFRGLCEIVSFYFQFRLDFTLLLDSFWAGFHTLWYHFTELSPASCCYQCGPPPSLH